MLAVVTTLDGGDRKKGKFNTAKLFGGNQIQHYHQAIAVVVAETFEQARAAAALVQVDYAEDKGSYDLKEAMKTAVKPDETKEPDSGAGDFDAAFRIAPVTFDETYTTPDQSRMR